MPGRRSVLTRTGLAAAFLALLQTPESRRAAAPAPTPVPLPTATGPAPPARFDVRSFGAAGDGLRDDSAAINTAVRTAIENGPGGTVYLPRGRYVLGTATQAFGRTTYTAADPGINLNNVGYRVETHLLVQQARGLTLSGEPGTVLVMRTPTAAGVHLERCEDVTLRQVAIDYDPLPFSQGTVEAVDAAAATFDWLVDDGYPDPTQGNLRRALAARGAEGGIGIVRAADGIGIKVSAGDGGDLPAREVVALGGGRFRFHVLNGLLRGLAPGDRLIWVARAADGGHAVVLRHCRRCVVDGVVIHSAPQLSFVPQDCDGITFSNCVIEPLAGSTRLLSTNGDGIHSVNNRQGPVVESCRFSRMGDDGVSIAQQAPQLFRAATQTELIVERHEYFRVGDRVAAIAQTTGLTRGVARITTSRLVQWRDRVALRITLDQPIAGLLALEAFDGNPAGAGSETGAAPAAGAAPATGGPHPDLVADLDATGSGFVVRNCVFADHRGSAMKLQAMDGVVENNHIDNVSRNGLRMGLGLGWQEVYHAQNIAVRRNTFGRVPWAASIWIRDQLAGALAADGTGNQNIVIEENSFAGYGGSEPHGAGAITIANAQGVQLRRNTFGAPDPQSDLPPEVTLDRCRDLLIEGNRRAGGDGGPAALAFTARVDLDSITLRDDELALAYRSSAGYSASQGQQQWSYQSWDTASYRDLTFDQATQRWTGPQPFLLVWSGGLHPVAVAAVKKWTAPVAALITIRGRVRLAEPGRGDGIRAEIVHNATLLWAQDVAGTDESGHQHTVVRRVEAGEAIYFRVSRRGDDRFDGTLWDPTISVVR